MGGLRSAFAVLAGGGSRGRLAERAAAYLGERLSTDYVVLARYAPRDVSSDVVPLVILGPHGVLVVELRDEEGALVCYQDHWYRRTAPGVSHPLSDSPSKRAHAKAQLRDRIERMRTELMTNLRAQFQREVERSARGVLDAVAPYTRFVRAENEKLTTLEREIDAIGRELARIRAEIERTMSS